MVAIGRRAALEALNRGLLLGTALALSGAGCVGAIGGDDETSGGLDNHPQLGPDNRYQCDDGPYPVRTEARRLTIAQYRNVVRDVFGGAVAPSAKYPGSYGKSATGFSTEPALYDVGDQTTEALMLAAEEVAESVAAALPSLLSCASAPDAGEDCASELIDTYVTRAYRRPVADDERELLLATFTDGAASGASFTEALAMMLVHALQTPQFLYVTEAAAPEGRELDGYEIASRLSFFLWDSAPDEGLLALAANGDLADPEVRRAEAQRMLDDPRSEGALIRFFREWTQTEDVAPGDKDPTIVEGFDADYAASMGASFDRFVSDQARQGSLRSLLTSKTVWVDGHMASFFGVQPPSDWQQVEVEGRSGLATQPLFLASAAHYGGSSYVFRGRFILKRLLCMELGAPPGDAQAQFDALPKPEDPTGKDLSASVNASPQCAGCHTAIDPGGLSLEHFGALGEYRDQYAGGKAIDPSGSMTMSDGDSISFQSYGDLFGALAEEPAVATCMGKQLVRFAMSRNDTQDDGCAVQSVGDVLAGSGTLAEGLVTLAASDAFAYRRD